MCLVVAAAFRATCSSEFETCYLSALSDATVIIELQEQVLVNHSEWFLWTLSSPSFFLPYGRLSLHSINLADAFIQQLVSEENHFWVIWGFGTLPRDTSIQELGKLGIKPATFWPFLSRVMCFHVAFWMFFTDFKTLNWWVHTETFR